MFFAAWPEPETRERLAEIRDTLECPKARLVAAEDLHMTLAFIGDVPNEHLPELQDGAQAIERRVVEVTLEEFNLWHNSLTFATSKAPAALRARHDALLEMAVPYAPKPPPRQTFRPHVTLLRRVRTLPDLPSPPKLRFVVSGFSLVRSDIDEKGAHYRSISDYAPQP